MQLTTFYGASYTPPREDEVPEHVYTMHLILFPARELVVVWRNISFQLLHAALAVLTALILSSVHFK